MKLTAAQVRALFTYDPATGEIRWNADMRRSQGRAYKRAGKIAGNIDAKGYRVIGYGGQGVKHKAHRLAWMYVHGDIPDGVLVDHIDGNPANNAIANLRLATYGENRANSKQTRRRLRDLPKGVHWLDGKYIAQHRSDGRWRHLGTFDTPEAAHDAYMAAARERFGEFARAA